LAGDQRDFQLEFSDDDSAAAQAHEHEENEHQFFFPNNNAADLLERENAMSKHQYSRILTGGEDLCRVVEEW